MPKKCIIKMFVINNVTFCYKASNKYYPQTLSEECKYERKKTKMENLINDESEAE